MKQELRKRLAMITSMALALSIFNPLTAQAAVKAPSKITAYLTSTGEYASGSAQIKVTGMTAANYVKLSSVKSSDTGVAEVNSIYGDYHFEKAEVKNNYCEINLNAKKTGSTKVTYKVGKAKKTTTVTVKKYTNPVKKITMDGLNGGKDFSSLTNDNSYVYGEYNSETGKRDMLFDVEATDKPVLNVEPVSGWSVRRAYLDMDENLYESYSKNEGKKYSGAQKFKFYSVSENAGYLRVYFVNNKDGGEINVTYRISDY